MPVRLADEVGTLRIRAVSDDSATRMACAGAVRRARLPAEGSSDHSVLVLGAASVCYRPDRDPASFEAELAGRVETARRAARPPGPGALGAAAVVFRDLGELVALYLADLASGRVGERWWWSVLSRSLPGAGAARDVLAAHVEIVPQVLAELRDIGELGRVVATLDAAACTDLVRRLTATFAAPRLPAALDQVRGAIPRPAEPSVAMPPVAPASPEVARRLLVAVALRLAEDPVDARSSRFARAVVRQVLAASSEADRADAPPAGEPARGGASAAGAGKPPPPLGAGVHPGTSDVPGIAATGWHRVADDCDADAVERRPIEPAARPDALSMPQRTGVSAGPVDGEIRVTAGHASWGNRPARPDPADGVGEQRCDERSDIPAMDGPTPETHVGADPVTELGGVFFLIEPVRQLRLPERFGPDGRLADRLGWWGTIELVARRLLPHDPVLADDPVWNVLAALSGGRSAFDRARSLVAADVRPAEAWDEGHGPIDLVPLDASLARRGRGAVRAWLDDVSPRLAALLADRLRCAPEDVARCLLYRRALLVHDRTHVDVHLPPASATAAVRRVGFDCDPGWVPELGRVITFHYDDRVGGT